MNTRLSAKPDSKNKKICLYNILFPIWLVILLPTVWLLLLPANFIIDSAALIVTLCVLAKRRGEQGYRPWRDWIRSIWLVWIFGFAADLLGAGFMLLGMLPGIFAGNTAFGQKWDELVYFSISANPFETLGGLSFTLAAIAFAGFIIFVLNNSIALKRLPLSKGERRNAALTLAIATAPYIMLVPSEWFWN